MNTNAADRTVMPPLDFAHLGEGKVAYVRELSTEEIPTFVPNAEALAPGVRLWALIHANGAPILIADSREAAVAGAAENDLTTVSVH